MIIFNTLLKIVKANKFIIILYTVLLAVFGTINMQTSNTNMSFTSEEPTIYIVNKDDKNSKITNAFISYLEDNTKYADIKNNEEAISDALFYRDVNYVIYIPENFANSILNGEHPKLDIKSNNSVDSSLAEMLVNNYINTLNIYINVYNKDVDLIIPATKEKLKNNTTIEIQSKIDTAELSNAANYYNFMNYSLIAACVYIICIVISSFKSEAIQKRTTISSINYKKFNHELLLSNGLLAFILWLIYNILGFILVGKVILSIHGLLFIANSFIFAICALTMAFLITNITINKSAISGIINVVALGSSFTCGAFVPPELLPDGVLKVAHILPSYWYIHNNEIIKTLEEINLSTLKPVMINSLIVLAFSLGFVVITNIISNKKRKLN